MSTNINTQRGPGCLVQLLWFIVIGWWLGQAAIALAYLCMVTVIGIPIGIAILHNVPMIISLHPAAQDLLVTTTTGGQTVVTGVGKPQLPFIVRAIWFVVFGWWLTALWVEVAYFLCAIIIGLPFGFWMFDTVPAVLTLRQS